MATEITVLLGKKIRELRKERSWRQIDLAAHAELSKTHVSELESGKREVGLKTLERIADALEVRMSEILASIEH